MGDEKVPAVSSMEDLRAEGIALRAELEHAGPVPEGRFDDAHGAADVEGAAKVDAEDDPAGSRRPCHRHGALGSQAHREPPRSFSLAVPSLNV